MQYSSLEDAFGTSFGQKIPLVYEHEDKKGVPNVTLTMESKTQKALEKNANLLTSVEKSLPLDNQLSTESFKAPPLPTASLDPRREAFTSYGSTDDDKLSRILRLIEQNRTGYAPASVQDMALYIVTGVFFLFTFDTFVTLGKSMRGR